MGLRGTDGKAGNGLKPTRAGGFDLPAPPKSYEFVGESQRMKRLNSKAKGRRGENDFIETVCELLGRSRGPRDRRNWQWTVYGGADNPDVEIEELRDLHLEVKNTSTFQFPAWTKKLLEDCSPSKVPVIAYKEARKGFWLLHRLEDIENFAVTWCQALGYQVEKGE